MSLRMFIHSEKPHELDRWENDEKFGLQRLLGVNSSVIRRVKDMSQLDNFNVDENEIRWLLQGLTLKEAIDARKLFIVDHAILDKCPKNPKITLCSPIALFFREEDKIMPIAIQLFQGRSDDNPVFFPTDDKYTWILAKMWFNNADAQIHQAISHFGFFKLLAPHLMAINNIGLKFLGCLPPDIVDRGVEPTDVPFYPFRDDAQLTYQAIEEYVDSYVSLYYRSDKVLIEIPEIQAWRVGHAAVNFKQYDEYALTLIGHPPKDKRERDLKEDAIPTIQPINKLLTLMGLTKVLSTRATNALGNFEVNYIHDPAAVELVEQFQKNLENTRKEIEKRNKTRSAERAYPFLNPAEIPNAISI
ncbi:polyunsaturated fatty acid 5-lipoxygenase-like [Mya arenaria]|uniref:polyunsaturated fatty acid 5-lipoxygenase-like n=1 Tax=Mya arenaria TaxID=6604 RepID=UPI0022E8C279|nr:polyunsaturated fatty acid 5-lipoxygenase-like [Mya arenaria]